MSMRSTKYDENFFNNLWNKAKEGLNIGTVHYYSIKSNFKRYVALNPNDYLTGTEDNLTKIFMNMEYKNLSINSVTETVYIYKKSKWILDIKPYHNLKKLIRERLKMYVKEELYKLLGNEITENIAKDIESKNKILLKVESKKTIDNVSAFIIQDLVANKKEEVFDTSKEQLYNLHFENGVYNLIEKKFRKRTKEDKVTKILDWNYLEKVPEDKIDDVNLFFKKLHTDEEQRKFCLSWLAYCLSGDTGLCKMKMNIGYTASNGKSTEFNIHSKVFPIYSKKIDNQTFNLSYQAKRHKQLLPLIRQPIRFVYCEELDQKKIDVECLKEVVDGKNLSAEVLYGYTEEGAIQCKINTCSNKDFNIEMDNGIARRGLVQIYKSKFKHNIEDDWNKKEFLRVDNYSNKFEEEEYKNAYLHILISHFSLNNFIPKTNEQQFRDIAEEYDEFSDVFNEIIEITGNSEDFVHKVDVLNHIKLLINNVTMRRIRNEFKKVGIKYFKEKMINKRQGCFGGIILRQQNECESDNEE